MAILRQASVVSFLTEISLGKKLSIRISEQSKLVAILIWTSAVSSQMEISHSKKSA